MNKKKRKNLDPLTAERIKRTRARTTVSRADREREIARFTGKFIRRYRQALEALAKQ